MIGVLEFCQSRGLTRLTMLAEHRLAGRIASYGWPTRYLGAPKEYEGGKGVAVAAEIEVGPHVLGLTRHKTSILGAMLFELDPSKTVAGKAASAPPSSEVEDAVREIGLSPLIRLVRAMAEQLSTIEPESRAQAIELIGAFHRLLEAFGASAHTETSNAPPPAHVAAHAAPVQLRRTDTRAGDA